MSPHTYQQAISIGVENVGVVDLVMIEVQSGEYLGEDDIVRFEDSYNRDCSEHQAHA